MSIASRTIARARRLAHHRADETPTPDWYYPQQSTCQIPTLHHLYSTFLGEREHGVFVEVGAYDGLLFSNTWGLAERGWRGVMVEPVALLATLARTNHSRHPAVSIHEVAVTDGTQPTVTLQLAGTLTTANVDQLHEYESVPWASSSVTGRTVTVPATTLDRLLDEVGVDAGFDVLVVDVEGCEEAVFTGFSLGRFAPKMLIVELADTHPDLSTTRTSDAQLSDRIAAAGYRIVYKDSINTVFVRDDVRNAALGIG